MTETENKCHAMSEWSSQIFVVTKSSSNSGPVGVVPKACISTRNIKCVAPSALYHKENSKNTKCNICFWKLVPHTQYSCLSLPDTDLLTRLIVRRPHYKIHFLAFVHRGPFRTHFPWGSRAGSSRGLGHSMIPGIFVFPSLTTTWPRSEGRILMTDC